MRVSIAPGRAVALPCDASPAPGSRHHFRPLKNPNRSKFVKNSGFGLERVTSLHEQKSLSISPGVADTGGTILPPSYPTPSVSSELVIS